MDKDVFVLPSMEYSFNISIIGKETKKNYEGSFVYKRLTLRDRAESGKMRCRLNGDLVTLDNGIQALHEMVSWLRYGLIEVPDWWKGCGYGMDLYDINVIEEIYKKVNEFEEKWTEKVFGDKKEDIKLENK